MKIGIDISQIVYGTGVSVYTQNLVENLLKIDKKNDYLLFGGSLRQKDKLQKFGAKIFSFPPTLADFVWNRLHLFPIENFLGTIDVFHSSDWTQPPTKAAKVTTIHDFGFLKYPEVAHPKIKAVMERRFKWIKKEVDLIIAVSQATKKDIMEILNIPEEKIRVIYEAVSEDVNQVKDQKIIQKVKKKYGLKGNYLLSVATLEPRKNLKRIIKAFYLLKKKDLSLVIVGKPGWDEEISQWGLKNKDQRIIFTGYISHEDKQALYSGGTCFVFPSLYEGFGLPILEAMKCGCPVVTSNLSSMPEVAGKAGILVDPLNVKNIAEGINQAIKDKQELVNKGFEQVKTFSWEKTARETLKVYEEVFKRK
jgi:glycosyltransferase involved in cell wall biosynthesis